MLAGHPGSGYTFDRILLVSRLVLVFGANKGDMR
jgi:hypothetical protein